MNTIPNIANFDKSGRRMLAHNEDDPPHEKLSPGAANSPSMERWAAITGLNGKAVLTIDETAKILRISERSLRDHIKDGHIPSLRLGRRVLIPVPGLLTLLTNTSEAA